MRFRILQFFWLSKIGIGHWFCLKYINKSRFGYNYPPTRYHHDATIVVKLSTLIVYLTKAQKYGVKMVQHFKGKTNPSTVHQLNLGGEHLGESAKLGLICTLIALMDLLLVYPPTSKSHPWSHKWNLSRATYLARAQPPRNPNRHPDPARMPSHEEQFSFLSKER